MEREFRGDTGVISAYFQKLFPSTEPSNKDVEAVLESRQPKVTTKMDQRLTLPFQADEVASSLSQMFPCKSPGLDGFPPFYFKKYGM